MISGRILHCRFSLITLVVRFRFRVSGATWVSLACTYRPRDYSQGNSYFEISSFARTYARIISEDCKYHMARMARHKISSNLIPKEFSGNEDEH